MRGSAWMWAACGLALAAGPAVVAGCGGGSPGAGGPKAAAPGGSHDESQWPADDRSLCEGLVHWKHNPELEADEMVGANALKPNIRRVYRTVGERESRHAVIVCREVDTNLDGVKDVVRTFNDKGEPVHEEADTNYDGKIDNWLTFTGGRISEEDEDTTFANGLPNVWKYFTDGKLSRIRRNTHCPNGKADTWEIYFNERLERVGVDNSCDGHVDRWDRDAQLMAKEEAVQAAEVDAGPAVAVRPAVSTGDAGAGAARGKRK